MLRAVFSAFGVLGAALTVLSQLAKAGALSDPFATALSWWPELLDHILIAPLKWLGFDPHPHFIAAVAMSGFLVATAWGARFDAISNGLPVPDLVRPEFLDHAPVWIYPVFAAIGIIFLLGTGDGDAARPATLWGSETALKYAFAITITAGLFGGDWIGGRHFHDRLLYLAVVVAAIVAFDGFLR